jgi:hypothetical protein
MSPSDISRVIEMAWEDRTPVRGDRGVLRAQRAGSHQAHAARNEAVLLPNVARARHGAKNKTREATGIQGRHLSLRHSKNALITSAPLLGIALLLHLPPILSTHDFLFRL